MGCFECRGAGNPTNCETCMRKATSWWAEEQGRLQDEIGSLTELVKEHENSLHLADKHIEALLLALDEIHDSIPQSESDWYSDICCTIAAVKEDYKEYTQNVKEEVWEEGYDWRDEHDGNAVPKNPYRRNK